MSKSRLEWKVGLFVFIGLALLGALLLQFSKGTTFFRHTYDILLHAVNVGGLKPKAGVLMAGVQVGTVADIKLGPEGTNVTITLRIYGQYEIHKDARFVIEQSGFLGDQYVAIMPTSNGPGVFHDQDPADAEAPFNLQEVARYAGGFLQKIDTTTSRLNDIITNVSRLLLNEATLTNLALTATHLREMSDHAVGTVDNLNSLIVSNAPAINQAVTNLSAFSDKLDGVANGLGDVVATNSPNIHAAVKNLEASTLILKSVMEDVEAGKGLAGKVLRDPEMAANIQEIANNLSITTSNLNRLGLWGILWKKKVPEHKEPVRAPKGSIR
jgi:phospholipid/cholesterol/gamma-HCH transport system substrate-binding protein